MPGSTVFTYANGNPQYKHKETGLCLAPGIGYMINGIELSLRPQYNLTAAGLDVYYWNVRLAYAIMFAGTKKDEIKKTLM